MSRRPVLIVVVAALLVAAAAGGYFLRDRIGHGGGPTPAATTQPAPGVAEAAGQKLVERYPGLVLAGSESPPYRPLTEKEEIELIQRLNASAAHILILAFGQPKGELWIAKNCERIMIPACIQLGASIDFVVGKVKRAPRWMQRIGMEWFFRFLREPRRLAGRYVADGWFAVRMIVKDIFTRRANRR